MGFIDLFYQIILGISECLIECYFFTVLTGKPWKFMRYAPLAAAGCAVISIPYITILLKIALLISVLFLFGVFVLKINGRLSLLYAVLILEVMQLCWGVTDSVTEILFPLLPFRASVFYGYIFMAGGGLSALCLACVCYLIILKYLKQKGTAQNQYVLMILIPLVLIFIVSGYIKYTVYGNVHSFFPSPDRKHVQVFAVQILAVASIFSILYAYQRLTDSFSLRTKLSMLEQESHFQSQYVEEARLHYEETRSLQHDMKNHLLVIKGLLDKGEVEKAGTYIGELDVMTENISFFFQTNNPVLDILLENKLALADSRGISVSGSLKVPFPCSVHDTDFCIILSNALDNAVCACSELSADIKKYIRISSCGQGDFLMIEIENSFDSSRKYKRDIGLSNIKWITEKYDGAMDISIQGNVFCLNVLLLISQHSQDISRQSDKDS